MEGEQWDKVRQWFVLAEGLGEPLSSFERRKMLMLLMEKGFGSREKIRSVFHWSDIELERVSHQVGVRID